MASWPGHRELATSAPRLADMVRWRERRLGLTQARSGFRAADESPGLSRRAGTSRWSGMDYDFCNVDGAKRLKQRIEEYWRERGYNVDVKLIEAGFVAAMRSARTDVRSDMVNGFPTRREDANARSRPSMRGLVGAA